jgi:ABC-type iron transport system FetAB ATPase subunit
LIREMTHLLQSILPKQKHQIQEIIHQFLHKQRIALIQSTGNSTQQLLQY